MDENDIIIFLDHGVSAERVIINTQQPFIDFRLIDSWSDETKLKLFKEKSVEIMSVSQERDVYLFMDPIKENYIFSLFEEDFDVKEVKQIDRFTLYSISMR